VRSKKRDGRTESSVMYHYIYQCNPCAGSNCIYEKWGNILRMIASFACFDVIAPLLFTDLNAESTLNFIIHYSYIH